MVFFIKKRGVTLVEIIIAIGILAIVLSSVYGFNLFGIRSYSLGESEWNLQNNVRMLSDLITNETRYASEVEITDKTPVQGDGYNYFRTEGKEVKFYKNGELVSVFKGNTLPYMRYEVDFTASAGNELTFIITAYDERRGKSYKIDSKVLCLNIPGDGAILKTPLQQKA